MKIHKRLPAAACASLALSLFLFLPVAAVAQDDEPVAKVAGETLTQADLEELLSDQLAALERQRRQLLEQGVTPLVERALLEHEAEQRDEDMEAMLQAEIEQRFEEVTDAAADAWYQQNQAQLQGRGSKEQLMPQIEKFLTQQGQAQARQAFVDELRSEYDVEIYFEPYREELPEEDATVKGPAEAPITIVEFSDFQCPACKSFNPTLGQVLEEYGDQVRVVFRQYPLRQIHPQAQKAAEASLCARDQGKFWELHDAMFANQGNLGLMGLKTMARESGLDGEAFDECLESGTYADLVQADLERGEAVGVSGTPAVYINGRAVAPGRVPSLEQMTAMIEEELDRKGTD